MIANRSKSDLIAHRGNVFGPRPELENRPEYLQRALDMGFSVEVDVWLGVGGLYTGHDGPCDPINMNFGEPDRVYWHCKNAETFLHFCDHGPVGGRFFLQDKDDVAVVASSAELWLHSRQSEKAICTGMVRTFLGYHPSAADGGGRLCSDHVGWYAGPPKLLVLDVDGVLALATKNYGESHEPTGKDFCDHDFTAIKRFVSNGIPVVLLSGDRRINEAMAKARGLPFYFGRDKDGRMAKGKVLDEILATFGARPEEAAYVGDDFYDLEAFVKVGYRFCPADAIPEVQAVAHPLARPGGLGTVAELAALYAPFLTKYPEEKESINYG